MAEQQFFDLVVIGGGPGGYVAAIRASQLGLSVAVVERENMGGVCLNWGCIPTKALLRTAEVKHLIEHADDFGIHAGEVRFELNKVIERSRDVAKKLSGGVSHLMKKNKITVITATARLGARGDAGRGALLAH
jgi:dihydrolipoamide dehydrogenase